jgi:gamma-glutamyltranspeptidase
MYLILSKNLAKFLSILIFSFSLDYLKTMNATTSYPFDKPNVKLADNMAVNFVSVNDHNDYMVSYVGTLGSAWGSRWLTNRGYFLNDALTLFSYDTSSNPDSSNTFDRAKQPRGLIAPILTYNSKSPCIRRLAISYSHGDGGGGADNDDFALTELTQVVLRLFTDFSLYKSALSEKRLQFCPVSEGPKVCFEDGFDAGLESQLQRVNTFTRTENCSFHSIDLVMKEDHVVYGQADTNRSQDSLVVFN